VLEAAGAGRVYGFRTFLYGVIRNVARRFEDRQRHPVELPEAVESNEASQSRLFDRTWARAIMAEAARLQRDRAAERGPEAIRRVELLRLRFEEDLPIRPACTAPMPCRARSSGPHSWKSSPSTPRAGRRRWNGKPRAC
jgi:RNA polymerase sigma-70 factor (ECF subfamily)